MAVFTYTLQLLRIWYSTLSVDSTRFLFRHSIATRLPKPTIPQFLVLAWARQLSTQAYSYLILCATLLHGRSPYIQYGGFTCQEQIVLLYHLSLVSVLCKLYAWRLVAKNLISLCSTVGIDIVRIVADFDIDHEDFTYSATYAASWGYAEAGVGIMAACGPTLRPILDFLLLKFRLHRPPSSLFTKLPKSVSTPSSTPGRVTPHSASEKDNDHDHAGFTPNSPFQPTGNRAQAAFDPTGMSPYILNDPTISEIVVSREVSITRETIIR